ncbi:hypothetical protein ACHHYP_09728 [Achlya hypogyna]|uniref:Transmembrane protein n=1 Tax=Achlya hypogyna TaxID=1202772 RepID=A0A1V9YMJ6_ACHHY|nr:hypothetical protein ACHHYP_09728 [Achlya hypogyna]
MANHLAYLGLQEHGFDSHQWNVPVHVLLQGASDFTLQLSAGHVPVSLSDLLYKACNIDDTVCATSFLPETNEIWYLVGKALAHIPEFDEPRFQDPLQYVAFQHVNSLSGWNKALVQYYIPGYAMAIVCMARRTQFTVPNKTSTVDTLAFCVRRPYDPGWVCENQVEITSMAYILQLSAGNATYLGTVPLQEVYLNPGMTAVATGGQHGTITLRSVPSVDEYQVGTLQAQAPWDVLCASSCTRYDPRTRLGWLLRVQGRVSITWICDSLMLTNTVFLWCITVYLVVLQWVFLRHSHICLVAVYLSKSVLGISILFVTFWGNANLQTLTTTWCKTQLTHLMPPYLQSRGQPRWRLLSAS